MTRAEGTITIQPIARLNGTITVPGDKSLSHRALMLGAVAEGTTLLTGLNSGQDVRATRTAIEALGVRVLDRGEVTVLTSPGFEHWQSPAGPIDCGNSGTTARLLLGLLAGCPDLEATLFGDGSLTGRPMTRVTEPLRSMGANVIDTDGHLPISIEGRRLEGITWRPKPSSAQVKSALMFAGLHAHGITTVLESEPTRDHTERLLTWLAGEQPKALDEPVITHQDSGATIISLMELRERLQGFQLTIPGDPSAAAFWMVAALCHGEAEIELPEVLWNPTRNGLVELLGPLISTTSDARWSGSGYGNEELWSPKVRSGPIPPMRIGMRETPQASSMIDELPIIALLATQAQGHSRIEGAGELRVKESDRLRGTAELLQQLGANIMLNDADGWDIYGPTPLMGGTVDSLGDHRLAMTAAVAGLLATGPVTITGSRCMSTSDPTFLPTLERLGAIAANSVRLA